MADPKNKNKQNPATEKPKNKLVSGMAKFAKENLNVEGKSKEEVEAIMLQDPKTYERIQKEFYNKIGKKDFATFEEFRDDVHSKYGNPFDTSKKKDSTSGSQAGSEAVETGVSEGQNTSEVETPTTQEDWKRQGEFLGINNGEVSQKGKIDPLTQNINSYEKPLMESDLFLGGDSNKKLDDSDKLKQDKLTFEEYNKSVNEATPNRSIAEGSSTGMAANYGGGSKGNKAVNAKDPIAQADYFLGEAKGFGVETNLNYDPTAPETEQQQIYSKLISQDNQFMRDSGRGSNIDYIKSKSDQKDMFGFGNDSAYSGKDKFKRYQQAYGTRMNALSAKQKTMEADVEFGKKYAQVQDVMQARQDAAAMNKELQEILTKNKLSAENLKDQVLLQQNPWLVEFLDKKAKADQLANTQINDPQIAEYEEIINQQKQLEKIKDDPEFIKSQFGENVGKEYLDDIAAQKKADLDFQKGTSKDASYYDYWTETNKNALKQVGYGVVDLLTGVASLPRMIGSSSEYGAGDVMADWANEQSEDFKAYFPEPKQIASPIFKNKVDEKGVGIKDKDGKIIEEVNWEAIPYKLIRAGTDLGLQVGGAGLIGRVGKLAGMANTANSARITSTIGQGMISFTQTYNQSFQQALAKGEGKDNAETFAVTNALMTAGGEAIAPNTWALKGASVSDNLFASMVKNGFKNPKAWKAGLKEFGGETWGEVGEELFQGGSTKLLETSMNIGQYKQAADSDQTLLQEVKETILLTAFMGGAMGMGAGASKYSEMNNLTKASAFYLANNTEYGVTQQKLKEQFKLQNIPASKQNEILQTLDDIKERFDVLPPDIKRSKYAANIVDLQAQIEEKKKQVTSPKLPDAIKNKLNEEINELDDRISDLVDKTELNFTSKDKYTKLEASKASIQEELAKEGITEERKTELTKRLNSVNNSLATLGDEQAMQDYEAANPKTAEYKAAEARVEEAKNKALDLRNQIDNASEDITPKAVAILKEQYQQAVQAFRTSEKELEVIASKREATATNTQTPAEPSQENPAETEATKAVPAFENAKEGDSVIINGKKVVVVGRSKSRKGNDVLVVEEVGATNSKEQIYQHALSDISRRTGETFKNIEKFRAGELSNLVDEYTKVENSRTNTITIDKEQWVSDAKPDETPKVESEATQTQATPESQAAETKVKEATAKVNDLQNQLDNVSDDVSDADYKALETQYQQATQELKDSEAELERVASEVKTPVQSQTSTQSKPTQESTAEAQSSVNERQAIIDKAKELNKKVDKAFDKQVSPITGLKRVFKSKSERQKLEDADEDLYQEARDEVDKEFSKLTPLNNQLLAIEDPDKKSQFLDDNRLDIIAEKLDRAKAEQESGIYDKDTIKQEVSNLEKAFNEALDSEKEVVTSSINAIKNTKQTPQEKLEQFEEVYSKLNKAVKADKVVQDALSEFKAAAKVESDAKKETAKSEPQKPEATPQPTSDTELTPSQKKLADLKDAVRMQEEHIAKYEKDGSRKALIDSEKAYLEKLKKNVADQEAKVEAEKAESKVESTKTEEKPVAKTEPTKFEKDVAEQTKKAREELADKARKKQKKKLEALLKKKGLKAEVRTQKENELKEINQKLNPKSEEVGGTPREIKINIAAATRRAIASATESQTWKDLQDDYRSRRAALDTTISNNGSQTLIDKKQSELDALQEEMHNKGQELVKSYFERITGLKIKAIENAVGRFDNDVEPSHVITFEVKNDAEFAKVDEAARQFSEGTSQDAYIISHEISDSDKAIIEKQEGKPANEVAFSQEIDFGSKGNGRVMPTERIFFGRKISQQEILKIEKELVALGLTDFSISNDGSEIEFQFFSDKSKAKEVDAEMKLYDKKIEQFENLLLNGLINDTTGLGKAKTEYRVTYYRAADQLAENKTRRINEAGDGFDQVQERTYDLPRNKKTYEPKSDSEVRKESELEERIKEKENKTAPKEDSDTSSGAKPVVSDAQKVETEKRLKEQAEEVKAVQSEITRLEKVVKKAIQKGETGIGVEINQKALIAAENLLKEVKARHKEANEPPKPKEPKKDKPKEEPKKPKFLPSGNPVRNFQKLVDAGKAFIGRKTEPLIFSNDQKPVEGYFGAVEASEITASNLENGQVNPDHPQTTQPKKWNSLRDLVAEAIKMKPRVKDLVNDTSDPFIGMPVVDESLNAIQGNNRLVGLFRHYKEFGGDASYKEFIVKVAAEYGLDPVKLAAMENPILVRVINSKNVDVVKLGGAGSDARETGGQGDVTIASAVNIVNGDKGSAGGRPPAVERIVNLLSNDYSKNSDGSQKSVPQLMQMTGNDTDGSKKFVNMMLQILSDAKAITPQQRMAMLTDGVVNKKGIETISNILTGVGLARTSSDSAQVSSARMDEVLSAVPPVARLVLDNNTIGLLAPKEGLGTTLYNAFSIYLDFRKAGVSFDQFMSLLDISGNTLAEKYGGGAVNIFRFLHENRLVDKDSPDIRQKEVIKAFREFLTDYAENIRSDEQVGFFGAAKVGMNQKDAATAASAKLLDKHKPQPENKPTSKPRESKGSAARNQATQRQATEAMVARLKKAFPKMKDVVYDTTLSGPGEYRNGQVYLNPDKMTMEDALEEHTHLYLELAKAINPTVFAEGVRVIKNTKEGQEILAEVKKDYPTYAEADQLNEAIAKAVARYGVNVKKPNLISRFVDRIRKIIGNKLRAMDARMSTEKKRVSFFTENFTTTKRFNPGKMTLHQYSKLIAGELLNETPLTYITTEQLENFTSGSNASQPITISRGILQGSPTRLDRFLGAITGNARTDMNQGKFVVDALRKQQAAVAAAQKQVVNNSYILGKNVLDVVNKKFANSPLKGKDLKLDKANYTTQLLSEVNEALGGDINVVNQLTADFPEIAKTVKAMREHIDKTTKELIEAGFLPDDDMVGQFNENLTVFFRRSFDIQKMVEADVKNGNITQAEADAKMQGITATSVTSKTTKGKGLSLEFTMQDGTKNKFEGLNSQDVYYLFGKVKGMEILKNDGTFEVEPQVLYQNPLYAVLMGNVGKYVNRSYAIHRAEKVEDYLHTVSDNVKAAAREFFAERLRNPEIASVSVQRMDNGNFTLVFQNKYGTKTNSHDERYSNLTADQVTDFFNDDSMLTVKERRALEILEAKKQSIKDREATTIDEILDKKNDLKKINDQINDLTFDQKEAKKEKNKKINALREARKALRTSAEKIAYEKKRIAKEVSEVYSELDVMKANFNALNAKSRRFASQIKILNNDKKNLTGTKKEIKEVKKEINAEIKALRAERVDLKQQRDALKAKITPLDNAKKQEIERLVAQMEANMEAFPKTDLEEKDRIAAIQELNVKYRDLTANERAAIQMEEEVNNPQRTTNFEVQMPRGLKAPNVQFVANSIDVERDMTQYLREQINKASSDGTTPSAKPGEKNMGIMETRKDIPKVLRDLMGQNADPMTVYENTVLKQANLLHAQQMINSMWQEGGEAMFSSEPTATLSSPMISKVGNSAFAPLDGKYTTPEMYAILFEGQEKEQNKAIRAWLMLNGMAKAGLTVYSLASNTRNFIGAGLMTLGTGNFNPLNLKKAFEITMENTRPGKHRQFYEDGVRLGVFGQNLDANILNAQLSRAMGQTKLTGIPLIQKFASKYYQFPDDMAKAMTMLGEIDTHRRAAEAVGETRTEEELMEMAAINTKATLPNYALTSRALQKLSRNAVFGTFVMFTAETIRTKWNTLSIAWSEITSGNPVYRRKGLLRATSVLGSLTIPPALAFLSMTAAYGIGMGEEEEKGFKATFPDYNKNNLFIYIGRNDDGSPIYLDFTFIDPSSYFHKPLIALAMGKDPEESFNGMLREVFMPFAGTEIFTKDTWNAINNTDDFGRKITDSPSIMWQGVKRGSYAGRNLMPKIVKEGSYMMQGLFNEFIEKEEDKYANYTRTIDLKEELMNNFMGTKVRSFDREKRFKNVLYGLKDAVDNGGKFLKEPTEFLQDANKTVKNISKLATGKADNTVEVVVKDYKLDEVKAEYRKAAVKIYDAIQGLKAMEKHRTQKGKSLPTIEEIASKMASDMKLPEGAIGKILDKDFEWTPFKDEKSKL